MKSESLVWILEDDPDAAFVFQEILEFRYQLRFFDTLAGLSAELSSQPGGAKPNLIIADLRLRDGNLLNFMGSFQDPSGHFRFKGVSAPIFVVSSCDDLDVLRACLYSGAVDYLIKPFQKSELIIKVERAIRNHLVSMEVIPAATPSEIIFDPTSLTIRRGQEVLAQFTAREVQIFSLMFKSKGLGVSRQEIESKVWSRVSVSSKTLDVHITNIRKKVEAFGFEIRHIPPNRYVLLGNGVGAQNVQIN